MMNFESTFAIPTQTGDNEKDNKRIPRPANAFMIFGKEKRKEFAEKFPQCTNKQISKLLGNEWKMLSPESREYYQKMAETTHEEHLKKYPGYYYSPLEARQRKAERKGKSGRGRKPGFNRNNPDNSNLKSFPPMSMPMMAHHMAAQNVRLYLPMLPQHVHRLPPIQSYPHGLQNYGPHHPFGGFVPEMTFRTLYDPSTPSSMTPKPAVVTLPIRDEHSYASYKSQVPQEPNYFQLPYYFGNNAGPSAVPQYDVKPMNLVDGGQWYAHGNSDLSYVMSNYMPPMENPSAVATHVPDATIAKAPAAETTDVKDIKLLPNSYDGLIQQEMKN